MSKSTQAVEILNVRKTVKFCILLKKALINLFML